MSWDFFLREVGSWWRVLSWGVSQSHLHLGRILHSTGLERMMVGEVYRTSLPFLGNGADPPRFLCSSFS